MLTSIIRYRTSDFVREGSVFLPEAKKSISSATAATLIATVIIIIVVGTYATLSFNSGSSETSITCSESTATFTVIQNGTAQGLSYPIPGDHASIR